VFSCLAPCTLFSFAMSFITPSELTTFKTKRVQDLILEALNTYQSTVKYRNPDAEGFYDVGLGSLGYFTAEEKQQIKEGIESELTQSGWEFKEAYGIYRYKIRPKTTP